METESTTVHYLDFKFKDALTREGSCYLYFIIRETSPRLVVLCVQKDDTYTGQSITNAAENIATQFFNEQSVLYDLDPLKDLYWIEHYPYGISKLKGDTDIVTFEWIDDKKEFSDPHWVPYDMQDNSILIPEIKLLLSAVKNEETNPKTS